MKAVFLLSVLLVGAFCASIESQLLRDLYDQWKLSHKKTYKSGNEDALRFAIFSQNYAKIVAVNQAQDAVVLGLNQFADLTTEEFRNIYTGYVSNGRKNAAGVATIGDAPSSVDWRHEGAVTPVKNQGSCGSCWAFSATGALEGLYFVLQKKLLSFSEQQLVDCVDACWGCNGGEMTDSYDYTATHGIEQESDYPYKARDQKCAYDSSAAIIVNNGYLNVTSKDTNAMKSAIAQQPISIGIQADQVVFQFYKAGVIIALCGDNLNHGVLAVGYDTIGGYDAFIVKNSWGENWGQKGYVYISTDSKPNNGNGVCGILAEGTQPFRRC